MTIESVQVWVLTGVVVALWAITGYFVHRFMSDLKERFEDLVHVLEGQAVKLEDQNVRITRLEERHVSLKESVDGLRLHLQKT